MSSKLPCQFCAKESNGKNPMFRCTNCGTVVCRNCSGDISIVKIVFLLVTTLVSLVYFREFLDTTNEKPEGYVMMFMIGVYLVITRIGIKSKGKCLKCDNDTLKKI